ncbi:MAG: hypothetical protein HY288_08305 [Planctomycetia bacterium]|nr:hypothetical protein [Planctomycetia bacterium]
MRKLAGPILIVTACIASVSKATEPITPESVESPADIAPNEPHAKEFSLERAARYLDSAALDWQKTHACTACHTMFPYLMARPTLGSVSAQSAEVRQFFEEIVAGKREAMPDYSCKDVDGAVAIGVAAAMALNDRWVTGKLHPLTRQALDHMWTRQLLLYIGREDAYKSSLASDGYATGFVIFVARQAGLTASDSRLQRGLTWLKSNQRESGRWFTPSQAWHTRHLISNAGTAYAVLALFACGELRSPH